MSDEFIDDRPTITFWIISGAALIWNLLGLFMYVSTRTATSESYAAQGYTQDQIAFINSTPEWALSAFAISVTAGVLASLFMLLRKSWAFPMFVLSFAAILAVNVNTFVLMDTVGVLGTVPVYVQSAVILVGILLVVYSRAAKLRGWLT
ncbi:MAG: hypothetical protein QNI96_01075 [Woeseiaceae bacterium]|nr:hypothetical protein [Woeseiaceae bacterium]